METAEHLNNSKSQAILVPQESSWQTFLEGLNSFTPDIFADGRDQGTQEERESI